MAGATLLGCPTKRGRESAESGRSSPPNALKLLFLYGSEKQPWIEESTSKFEQSAPRLADGRPIIVDAVPTGSGELVDEILSGRRQAHLASPASALFVTLGNATSRAQTGHDLLGSTESLVVSPVVVAMWRPMAEALGWGRKPIGWGELLAVARDPRGWAGRGHPEWGAFRFGHTHPEYSNSGLIAVLAEVYAATGKTSGLTTADLERPEVARLVGDIERAVVHYGSSTGFLGRRMFGEGPGYLSATVLYENMVIESYRASTAPPLVAIYPREGTFWSDHPVGVVEREWVTPAHREAAKRYIAFLLAREQQERALAFGFRPAEPSIAVGAPVDAAHGVNPAEPRTTLEVPTAEVMHRALALWAQHKKRADVVLALDVSGSMQDEGKWNAARAGAETFLDLLADGVRLGDQRATIKQRLDGMFASGGTALYDAIDASLDRLHARPDRGSIQAVVVLTDGDDRDSKGTLAALRGRLRGDRESENVRVFTIGYGRDARGDILKDIAERSRARFSAGNPATIREVFKDISTFF